MLLGKTILVTGGSGSLGQSICSTCARYGAQIAFSYHKNSEKADALAKELENAGTAFIFEKVNGCKKDEIDQFISRVEASLGAIDVLVNCLGIIQVMPFALIEEEDWDETLLVNLKSMFLFSKAVVRSMIRRKKGVILNLGSIAGHRLLEVPVHYATAKAGVTGFTLSLATELSRYGIRVNEIAPGLLKGGIGMNVSERQLSTYNQFCALGRPGNPDEVAELVAFMASDRASYINAQTFFIDGGL